MAAAATMAAAARELVLRAGASDLEEEEGPLVRTQGFFSSGISSCRPRVGKTWAGLRHRVGAQLLAEMPSVALPGVGPEPEQGPEWSTPFN